jgi:hypothetical protein
MRFTAEKKKKKEEANGAVLNGTISLLLPLDTQRTGEEEAFSLPFFILSLSPKTQKTNAPTCPFTDTTTPSRQKGHTMQNAEAGAAVQ